MTPRKYRRGTTSPGGPSRRGRRRVTKTGKSRSCSMAVPAAAYDLLVTHGRLALVRWQMGRAS